MYNDHEYFFINCQIDFTPFSSVCLENMLISTKLLMKMKLGKNAHCLVMGEQQNVVPSLLACHALLHSGAIHKVRQILWGGGS